VSNSEGRKNDTDSDKLRYDLFPQSLGEVAYVYTIGAQKYEDRNWENGIKWGRVFRAMMQHAWAWWWGGTRHEKGMHHLASVAWCALALMEYEHTHPEMDDRKVRETEAEIRSRTFGSPYPEPPIFSPEAAMAWKIGGTDPD